MIARTPLSSAVDAAAAGCPFHRTSGAAGEPREAAPAVVQPAVEAHRFMQLMQREGAIPAEAYRARLAEAHAEIAERGDYWQTPEELAFGAKIAWRNSARCIGRLYWQKLLVRDLRHLSTAEEVFDALVEHLRLATNGGKLQSVISVFAPQRPGSSGIRIWNSQLIRYAGYRRHDGTVLGDPVNVELTDICRRLGWEGGEGTPFDILPLVIQMPGEEPRLFELPSDAVLEVPISHPDYPWFEEMGLKWHAVPAIASMRMEIGGVSYTAAPFNGWYMGTEIGARNLGDEQRYDLLPWVAKVIGLETRSNRSLWRDRALVELNVAVLHSFQKAGVTIIDHHSASKHFVRFEEYERQADRPVSGDWSWLVPPISGSASPLFHREYHDTPLKPNYFPQPDAWRELVSGVRPQMSAEEAERAERDVLTGLLHRGALDTRLARFARDGGAVLLLDLDRFADVNAVHGEIVGNAVLRQVGRALVGALRPDDECARTGGDEFCVLLRGVQLPEDADLVADRIRQALSEVLVEGAPELRIGASFGQAIVHPGDDATAALREASAVLRDARRGADARPAR